MLEKMEKALKMGLPPGQVKKRRQGGKDLSYVEGWQVIETANAIFGHDGWQQQVKDLTVHRTEKAGYEVVAQVALRVDFIDGAIVREDVGVGTASAKQGLDLAAKEAVTDGMKRAFRTLGNRFGNSLYDKANTIHSNGEDSHLELFSDEDSGNVLQMIENDMTEVTTIEEWQKVCARYQPETARLNTEWKDKARTLVMSKKENLTKEEVNV